ncbi:MAG: DUF5916 domain-containing protein [Acidobacteriota bacterium]
MPRSPLHIFVPAGTVVLVSLAGGAGAQAPPPLTRAVVVAPATGAVRLDGRLDEPAWADAPVHSGFVQREPRSGEPATHRTDVRVIHTDTALLVAARLHGPPGSTLIATEYRRDADLDSDDTFEVYLDTFHDHRNAFYFATNPLGAQRDALVRNEGEDLNWQWDGIWDVSCTRDRDGWTVEMSIPFSTLRYRPGVARPWGINFGRLAASMREESYLAPISRDFGFFGKWRVSAFATLSGLPVLATPSPFRVWPFAVGGWDRDFEDAFRSPNGWAGELGVDAKIGLGASGVADVTYNTDFAQVEADQQQVNLTRFPLFFPEKRTFFLENAGLFKVGERTQPFEPPTTLLFFSRRIGLSEDGDVVPIVGGARVTGKAGAWDFGAFDIVTDAIRLDGETRLPRTNFAALRVKRDVLRRSTVGAMYLSKVPGEEGTSNQVFAADGSFSFGDALSIIGFAAKSLTPGLNGSSHAFSIDAALNKDRYGWGLIYADIGDDFNSEMGFLQRTGIRKYRGGAYVGLRPGWRGVRQVFLGPDVTYITDRQNRLQTLNGAIGPAVLFEDGSILFAQAIVNAEGLTEPFELRDGVEIPEGTYRGTQFVAQYMPNRGRRVSVGGGFYGGGFYGGTLAAPNVSLTVRLHQRLRAGVDYFRSRVDVPIQGGTFTTNLIVGRATLAFSPKAFVSALVQRDDDTREVGANVVFRYTYQPGADLFVVFDDARAILGGEPPTKRRRFLVKLTYYLAPG